MPPEQQQDKLTVTWDDLTTRKVDARLKEQAAQARNRAYAQLDAGDLPVAAAAAPPRSRLWYNAVVFMTAFGVLGGLLAWGLGTLLRFKPQGRIEANELIAATRQISRDFDAGRIDEDSARAAVEQIRRAGQRNPYFVILTDPLIPEPSKKSRLAQVASRDAWKEFIGKVLAYGVAGMMIAVCLAIAEPATDRNLAGVVVNGSVGAAAGLAGGVVVSLFVERIYDLVGGAATTGPGGVSWPRQLLARSLMWGVLGLFLSVGPGVVMRNRKKLLIGALGGLIGGLVGGALFDLVARSTGRATVADLVGLVAIGALAGASTGLIENAAKTGWVRVIAGLIAGKQFILYRNPTYIGSAPDCQIYLFKDPRVGRRHAAIHLVPGGFELEDLPLGARTLVNDKPVTRTRLRHGDRVQVGATCFLFQEKSRPAT